MATNPIARSTFGLKDITGQRFGRLVVLERADNNPSGTTRWRCRCDCGNETKSTGCHLRGGRSLSCGCAWTARKPSRKPRSDAIDLVGAVIGSLTILERLGRGRFRCRCECGRETITLGQSIRKGKTRSCGCLIGKTAKQTFTTHGKSDSPEYKIWCGIIARCTRANVLSYGDYGGRGIAICERWRNSFANFIADVGPRPSKSHSLDRIDVNGNYEPANCRWATRKEQSANKRKIARIEQFTIEELRAEIARREKLMPEGSHENQGSRANSNRRSAL